MRAEIIIIIVSNHIISTPLSPFIKRWIVGSEPDAADTKIVENIEEMDLVITADIPLADRVITKKAIALNPRGDLYSENNIKSILALRNFNESLRSSGLLSGGANKIHPKDIQNFSNNLDRIITKYSNKETS